MRSRRRRFRDGLAVAVLLLVSGCASANAKASRELADTVKVQGYRQLSEKHKQDTTTLTFVGPAGVDLSQAVSARDWSPQPPPSGLPDTTPFEWILDNPVTVDDHPCNMSVRKLRPGNEALATGLDAKGKQELAEGKLAYIEVATVCADAR